MDKLQPILKQKYWICFGFALIFAFTGWWLGSNAIGTEITARRDVIEKAFQTAGQGADKPNQKWIEGAKALNLKDKEAYDASSRSLWERQKAARVWHPEIQKEISTVKFQDKIPQLSTRAKWATLYPKQFNEVLSVVKPFDVQTGTGLVVVNPQRITHKPFNSWVMRRPVSEEIWKSQEDLWLLKSLLSSIANVNGDASRITEASIREIVTLRLRGGDPAAAPTSGSAAGGGFGGGGSPSFGSAGGTAGAADGAVGGEGGMATGGGAGRGPWESFEGKFGMDLLTEQFGSADGAAAGGAAGGGSEDGGVLGGGFAGGMGAGGMTRGSTFGNAGGGQAAAEEADRYVHDADDLPYKTRAFFLHVKMREEQVAELLASLTNSDFPVEIVRVDMKTNASGGAGASGMMSGGGAGMSSGMGGMGSGGGIGGAPGMDMGGGDAGEGLSLDGGGGAGMSLGGGGYSPPGMGGGDGGLLSGDGLAGGAGLGPDGGDLYSGYGAGQQQTGQQAMAAAFSPDQNLIELRVAGLMTLYQTKDEAEAQSETEAGTAQEAATSGGGGVQPAPAGDGTTPAADGTTPPADGTTPPAEGTTPPAEGTTPAAEGTTPAAEGTPAPAADGGAAPAEGTSPPAEGTTPAPSGDGSTPPADGTGTTPADPATPAADPNAGPAPASPEPGGTAPPAAGGNP